MKKINLVCFIFFIFCSCHDNVKENHVVIKKNHNCTKSSYIKNIDGYDYTELGMACKKKDLKRVAELISNGADVNIAKKDDISEYDALYVAIENNSLSIVNYLIQNKANVNQTYTEDGLTSVGLATKLNEMKIVESLLQHGANVNGVDMAETDYKIIPLLIAVENDNIQIAKLLLKYNDNTNITDKDGNTCKSLMENKGKQWQDLLPSYSKAEKIPNLTGKYYIEIEAISKADEHKKILLKYYVSIESDTKAILSIGAEEPQDYWCEGDYYFTKEGNILHGKGKCDQDDTADFYIKYENGKYYIQSKRFLNQDWQQIEKKE